MRTIKRQPGGVKMCADGSSPLQHAIPQTLSKLVDGSSDELRRTLVALLLKLVHIRVVDPTTDDLPLRIRRDATTSDVGYDSLASTPTCSDAHGRSGTGGGSAPGVWRRRARMSKAKRDKAKAKAKRDNQAHAGDDAGDVEGSMTATNHGDDGSLGIDSSGGGKGGGDGGTLTPALGMRTRDVYDGLTNTMRFALTLDFLVGTAGAVCAMIPSIAGSLPDGLVSGIGFFDAFFSYFFIAELFVRWKCYRIKYQECATFTFGSFNKIDAVAMLADVLMAVGGLKPALARSLRGLRVLRLLSAAEPIPKAQSVFDRKHGNGWNVLCRYSRTLLRGEDAEPRPGDGGCQALDGGDDGSGDDAGLCSTATTTTRRAFGPARAACALLLLVAARVDVATLSSTDARAQSSDDRQGAAETAADRAGAAYGTFNGTIHRGRYIRGGRHASGTYRSSERFGVVAQSAAPVAPGIISDDGGYGAPRGGGCGGGGGGYECGAYCYESYNDGYDYGRSGDGVVRLDGWGGGSYDGQDATAVCATTYGVTDDNTAVAMSYKGVSASGGIVGLSPGDLSFDNWRTVDFDECETGDTPIVHLAELGGTVTS